MNETGNKPVKWLTGTVILCAIGAIVTLFAWDLIAPSRKPEDQFRYKEPEDTNKEMPVASRSEFPVDLPGPSDMAFGPKGLIYIGGKGTVARYRASGEELVRFPTGFDVRAVAVDGGQYIYAASLDSAVVLDPTGEVTRKWAIPGDKAYVTDIAVGDGAVYVAESTSRTVLKFSMEGKLVRTIGKKAGDFTGFVIPSPFFTMFIGSDGLLRVANPGRHRVDVFTAEGEYKKQLSWGRFAKKDPEGFTGCCNPTSIAPLPGGGVVTTEKSIPRVKIYGPGGRFEGVLSASRRFQPDAKGLVALCGPDGRIYILEGGARKVHIIEREQK
jgi:hypothetical protein